MSVFDDIFWAKSLNNARKKAQSLRSLAAIYEPGNSRRSELLRNAAQIEEEIKRLKLVSSIHSTPDEQRRAVEKLNVKVELLSY